MRKLFLAAYEIECPEPQRLFMEMEKECIEARGVVSHGDTIELTIPFMSVKRFKAVLFDLGLKYTEVSPGLFSKVSQMLIRRAGLIVGAVICAAAMVVLEHFVLNIRILTDRDDIRSDIMNVLAENDVQIGSYIPSLKCAELERSMKQRVVGISWAGITKTDSTIIIDVVEKVEQPEFLQQRLPSDLVAKHSGTIEEIELYDGLLKVPVGSGVVKGEVVVSGRIPVTKTVVRDGKASEERSERYVRSLGKAYGRYSETRTFSQPYEEECLVMNGIRDDRCYLRVFSARLPLFFSAGKGSFRESEEYYPLVIFDRELPVGMVKLKREGFSFRRTICTKEQAEERVMRKAEEYELNFLKDEEIIDRKYDVRFGKNGATLTVNYDLFGIMTEEKQFFIKK